MVLNYFISIIYMIIYTLAISETTSFSMKIKVIHIQHLFVSGEH